MPSVGLQTTEVLQTLGVWEYNAHIMGNQNKTWYVYLLECADGTLYTGKAWIQSVAPSSTMLAVPRVTPALVCQYAFWAA